MRSFSVSADGQSIVFERAATLTSATSDLWIMNRDGSGLHRLVNNGRIPNWSLQALPAPLPAGAYRVYLPVVIR